MNKNYCLLVLVLSFLSNIFAQVTIPDEKVIKFIEDLKINIGTQSETKNLYIDSINLSVLEKIVGIKMIQDKTSNNLALTFGIDLKNVSVQPEIGIFHYTNPAIARVNAIRIFILIEQGRAPTTEDVAVSYNSIGDFCLRPKKTLNDPHGFEMIDSDKTFIIFTRNNSMVYIDSKFSFQPKIDVIKIASEIDKIFKNIN